MKGDRQVRVLAYRSRGPGCDSRYYQNIWEVNTTEKLLGRKCSGSGLESREYGSGNQLCWPCDTFYEQKLANKRWLLGRYSSLADWGHGVVAVMALREGFDLATRGHSSECSGQHLHARGWTVHYVSDVQLAATPAPAKAQVYFQKS
jgi:hypothetical protein